MNSLNPNFHFLTSLTSALDVLLKLLLLRSRTTSLLPHPVITFSLPNHLSVWFDSVDSSLSSSQNRSFLSCYDTSRPSFIFSCLCNCSFSNVTLNFSSSDCIKKVSVLQCLFPNPNIYLFAQTSFLTFWLYSTSYCTFLQSCGCPLPQYPIFHSAISLVWLGTVLQTIPFCIPTVVNTPKGLCPGPHARECSSLAFLQLCHYLWAEGSLEPRKCAHPAHHLLATQDPRNPCVGLFPWSVLPRVDLMHPWCVLPRPKE